MRKVWLRCSAPWAFACSPYALSLAPLFRDRGLRRSLPAADRAAIKDSSCGREIRAGLCANIGDSHTKWPVNANVSVRQYFVWSPEIDQKHSMNLAFTARFYSSATNSPAAEICSK